MAIATKVVVNLTPTPLYMERELEDGSEVYLVMKRKKLKKISSALCPRKESNLHTLANGRF
jgi:hypothetical protein